MKYYFFGVFKGHPGEIAGLNGIRAIAYFMLIYAHFFRNYQNIGIDGDTWWINNFLMNGSLCMDAFFVLSGFLIGGQLFYEINKSNTLNLKKFFLKRVLRIFPPYYLFLILSYLWAGSLMKGANPEVTEYLQTQQRLMLWDALYLTDYIPGYMIHGWSLSVEEKFYILLPFLLLFLNRFKSVSHQLIFIGVIYIIPLFIRTGLYLQVNGVAGEFTMADYNKYMYYPFHGRIDSIMLGVLFAGLYTHFKESVIHFVNSPVSAISAGAGGLILVVLMLFTTEEEPGLFTSTIRFNIAAFAWLFIMMRCFAPDSKANRFFSLGIFVPVARLSYCAYIIHLIPLGGLTYNLIGVRPVTYGEIFAWTIPIALMILGIAYLYYLIAERPFLVIKEKLTGRKPAVTGLQELQKS